MSKALALTTFVMDSLKQISYLSPQSTNGYFVFNSLQILESFHMAMKSSEMYQIFSHGHEQQ